MKEIATGLFISGLAAFLSFFATGILTNLSEKITSSHECHFWFIHRSVSSQQSNGSWWKLFSSQQAILIGWALANNFISHHISVIPKLNTEHVRIPFTMRCRQRVEATSGPETDIVFHDRTKEFSFTHFCQRFFYFYS